MSRGLLLQVLAERDVCSIRLLPFSVWRAKAVLSRRARPARLCRLVVKHDVRAYVGRSDVRKSLTLSTPEPEPETERSQQKNSDRKYRN